MKDLEEFVLEQDQAKKKGLQEIKDKYNELGQKINLDAGALLLAIQKKRQHDKEAMEQQKHLTQVTPVSVEVMSDKGDDQVPPAESENKMEKVVDIQTDYIDGL